MAKNQENYPDDIAAMSFESALAELESVVAKLEGGQVPLEDSIDMYTRGSVLKRFCEEKLAAAQARVDKVVVSDGKVSAVESDLE